ncbi:hypothetical protein Tco_1511735 [Tanacetum coccineum]
MRLCQISGESDDEHCVMCETLVALLRLLKSPAAFNNVTLRHYLFCILQVLAGRPPTLCGVPRDETLIKGHTEICNELKNFFAAIVNQSKPPEESLDALMLPYDGSVPETNTVMLPYDGSVPETNTVMLPYDGSVPERNTEPNIISVGMCELD